MFASGAATAEVLDAPVPRQWLRIDVVDIVAAQVNEVGGDTLSFFRELHSVFAPVVRKLKKVFVGASLQGVGQLVAGELSQNQFLRFCKEVGLVSDNSPMAKQSGARLLASSTVDLLYRRVNMTEVHKTERHRDRTATAVSEADIRAAMASLDDELPAECEGDAGDDEGDGGAGAMVLHEFVAALVRLAWDCYGEPGVGIGARLDVLLSRSIWPGCAALLDHVDPMDEVVRSRRVCAVTEYYLDHLKRIFLWYACQDKSVLGQANAGLENISFAELVLFVNDFELLESLSMAQVTEKFAYVNAQSAETGEDDDAQQLSLHEFIQLLARFCDIIIPEAKRFGEPFEYTWQAWLATKIVPTFRAVKKGGGAGRKR